MLCMLALDVNISLFLTTNIIVEKNVLTVQCQNSESTEHCSTRFIRSSMHNDYYNSLLRYKNGLNNNNIIRISIEYYLYLVIVNVTELGSKFMF